MATKKDSIEIDFRTVKALSKEQRVFVAKEIRKDGDLWNAINGVGGLSEFSDNARLQGTVTKANVILPRAKVEIFEGETSLHKLITNEQGYFKIDIVPGNYNVVVFDGKNEEEISVKALQGVTSTINHDFKSDGGGLPFS